MLAHTDLESNTPPALKADAQPQEHPQSKSDPQSKEPSPAQNRAYKLMQVNPKKMAHDMR